MSTPKHPSPAIVSQAAARRLPRLALLLLCCAYVLPGYFWRDAWRSADITALGFMAELAQGQAHWLAPTLLGAAPDNPALLPYWLGAWAMQAAPAFVASDFAARIPFALLLALTLFATWYGVYHLAQRPQAQPVAFAFGGEAHPKDYARAIADGGLLAFIACLGLAQLSHEATPALAQLAFAAVFFYALCALPSGRWRASLAAVVGLGGLSLSGAPFLALALGLLGAALHWREAASEAATELHTRRHSVALVVLSIGVALLAWQLQLWRWKVQWPRATWDEANGFAQLLLWFTWPAGPLALWTLWRWRHQLLVQPLQLHLALPCCLLLLCLGATLTSSSADRNLLLALPALAALAAFALPTLQRQMSALIDWFTLLFFSGCGFTIWVIWIATQTGFPPQPAANVERLAPGYVASFSLGSLAMAVLATWAWASLVRWRVGRHRAAIWKSLALPAGGAALCWLLLMTLWMPLLNYAQSYNQLVAQTLLAMPGARCAQVQDLDADLVAAFQFYGHLTLSRQPRTDCPWLLLQPNAALDIPASVDSSRWQLQTTVYQATDHNLALMLLRQR